MKLCTVCGVTSRTATRCIERAASVDRGGVAHVDAHIRADRFIARPNDLERYALPAITRHGLVHVTDGGTRLYEAAVTPRDWIAFRACLALHGWAKEKAACQRPSRSTPGPASPPGSSSTACGRRCSGSPPPTCSSEHAAGSLGDEAYLARLKVLRQQRDAVTERTAAGQPAEPALEWLRALGEPLQAPETSKEKAGLMHAIYDRITVAGPEIVGVRLKQAAYARGLARALPEEVELARPTGVGRGITTYEIPIEGRDEWLAAAGLLA